MLFIISIMSRHRRICRILFWQFCPSMSFLNSRSPEVRSGWSGSALTLCALRSRVHEGFFSTLHHFRPKLFLEWHSVECIPLQKPNSPFLHSLSDSSHVRMPEFYPWEINENAKTHTVCLTVLKVQYVNRKWGTYYQSNCKLLLTVAG